ncbi:MAG: hypothetical protein GY750_15995 [Lentisphaerae bacterium]|nr:hypothetical protein [Lentisphaerota bacterium]
MVKIGNLKDRYISIAKLSNATREIGEAHSTNDSKDNITFDRKGALL